MGGASFSVLFCFMLPSLSLPRPVSHCLIHETVQPQPLHHLLGTQGVTGRLQHGIHRITRQLKSGRKSGEVLFRSLFR